MEIAATTEAEKALLGTTEESGEEVTDVIVNPDFGDEPHVDREGQAALFPAEARQIGKQTDLTEAFKSVEARLKKVKDHANFFKSFAAFISELDVDPDRETIRENIKTALVKAVTLQEDLEWALTQFKKVEEIEEELGEIAKSRGESVERTPHPVIKFDQPDDDSED
jgi:multidrug efflux pump subunit AcrB